MKRLIAVVGVYLAAALLVYHRAFSVFFAQDDFILIQEYSAGTFFDNVLNLFKYPSVSHFRPIDNLYYLLSALFFGKSYQGFHLVTLLILVYTSLLVYQTLGIVTKSKKVGLMAGFFYVVSAVHFNSLYWISGNATLIGFCLFITAFYLFLKQKQVLSAVFLFLSFLASESLLMAVPIIIAYAYLFKVKKSKNYALFIGVLAVLSGIARLLFFTQAQTFSTYQIQISPAILQAVKYYLARLLGLSESSGDLALTMLILAFDLLFLGLIVLDLKQKLRRKYYLLSAIIVVCGLFPFVLIPNHLAANYMGLSLLGVCLAIGSALKRVPVALVLIIIIAWALLQAWAVKTTEGNTWITKRAKEAQNYLQIIERASPAPGSTIFFAQTATADSREAYIVLGGGRALDFWFADKNYKACFEFIHDC